MAIPLRALAVAALVAAMLPGGSAGQSRQPSPSRHHSTRTLSILSTTDLHGYALPADAQGGVALFGGYVQALRAARAADGGAVLLVDAGDTFQGGVESDLSEGALVVDAYNALGYHAAAIGNHEFDFGAVDEAGAREGHGDRRGAIKARARQARFPFLAANLIDEATGRPVEWTNVHPSAIVDVEGIKVGLVGVMTAVALRATLPANAGGLHVAPLAPAIQSEAEHLRRDGAEVVVVVSHAGGRCTAFDDPHDLSSCDRDAEIFEVARALPAGLVDVIAAGHSHEAVAHVVNGVAVVQAYARGQAFARVDLTLDAATRRPVAARPFPPRPICSKQWQASGRCNPPLGSSLAVDEYEGRPVAPDPAITAAMAPALARIRAMQAVPLGVSLATPLPREDGLESPLGNAFAEALLENSPGADAAITNNRIGGLRADLPPGPLTFGQLYDVFPFDNRVVRLRLTGGELARAMRDEVGRRRPGALAIAGLHVRATCVSDRTVVSLQRPSGKVVTDDEPLIVATVDSLAAGVVFAGVRPPGPVAVDHGAPLLREVVERWFRQRPGTISAGQFVVADRPRWDYEGDPLTCAP